MPNVFVTRRLHDRGLDLLRDGGFALDVWPGAAAPTPADLRARAARADALLCTIEDRVDVALLAAAPGLRVVSNHGVGVDNIDVAACTRRGVPVGNTPDVVTNATADLALTLLLAVARRLRHARRVVTEGRWQHWEPLAHLALDVRGKTLGVVGMGRIGQEMARLCRVAFRMRVLYTARTPKPDAEAAFDAQRVSFETLLRESDFVSVHADLNESTHYLFDACAFSLMKPTAVFVNTARGPVHDQRALTEALRAGRLAGAGLDVTDPEPMAPDDPLLALDNVVVLPHLGTATDETRAEMSRVAAQNIVEVFRGAPPVGFVNPEVRS